ncbi:hypothetical protein QE152_g15707 [Popillia japonica]|uniref:Uncharacterized protein n=1 Tax=Popillia japonica TaxID=7064 RepID=A0AAW1L865_POPJA
MLIPAVHQLKERRVDRYCFGGSIGEDGDKEERIGGEDGDKEERIGTMSSRKMSRRIVVINKGDLERLYNGSLLTCHCLVEKESHG